MRCLSIKEPYTNALQVAIAVFIATALGYGIVLPDSAVQSAYARQFSQACKWSAITSLTISAPVIGKVAQTGAERILGTFVGGSLGFLTYIIGRTFWSPDTRSDGVTLSLAATIVAFSSVVLGKKLNLAYSAKLYGIAFLIVTFGAVDEETTGTSVFLLASMRVLGIACGVILLEITAILVFPRSATQVAVEKMGAALQKLAALNQMTWVQGPWQAPQAHAADTPAKGSRVSANGYEALPGDEVEDEKKAAREQEELEDRYEKMLMDVYDTLYKVEEQTPLTASEVYLFTWRGHLCFLPGLPWLALGRWHLPKQQMDALATCVRRVARLLWSVHVSFMDGFDENMLYLLQQQYPADLMPLLAEYSQGALQEALDAFPTKPSVISSNLTLFATAVEGLMRISDYQRRRILHLIKHFKSMHKQQAFGASRSSNSRAMHAPPQTALSADHPDLHRAASEPQSGMPQWGSPHACAPEAEGGSAAGGAPAQAAPSRLQPVPELRPAKQGMEPEDVFERSTPEELMLGGHGEDKSGDGALARPRSSSLSEALASESATAAKSGSKPPLLPPKVQPQMHRPEIPWTANSSTCYGTPSEALRGLPDGLHIDIADGSEQGPEPGAQNEGKADVGGESRSARRLSTMRLQRVESMELVEFPDTMEGLFGKVRWYSFLFTMQELAEEMEDLHDAADEVLASLHKVMGC